MERTGAANVGGLQRVIGKTFFERAVAIAMTTRLGAGDARHRLGGEEGPTDTAYLGACRRKTICDLQGYDPFLVWNEDYEFNYRLRKRGKVVWFDPKMVVDYHPRSTFRALARQYFNYGRGKSAVMMKHPKSTRLRHLPAPGVVLALAAGFGLLVAGFWEALTIPLIYILVILVGSVVIGFRRRDAAAVLLPPTLVTMHLTWGIGIFFPARRRKERERRVLSPPPPPPPRS